jgi:hypothetical protein
VKSDLAGLSLNKEASQKELEGVRKIVQRGAAANIAEALRQ